MSTAENINNAIAELTRATALSNASPGTKAAVGQMGAHWERYWRSNLRKFVPDALDGSLGRYVDWYTRAWILVPAGVRAQARSPETLDPSYAALAADTLAQHLESLQHSADQGVTAARWAAEKTVDLSREIRNTAAGVGRWTLVAGAGVLVGLWLYQRR